MGEACGTCGRKKMAYRVLVGKSERKRALRPWLIREDNIRIHLKGTE